MAENYLRLINTTIQNHFRETVVPVLRNRKLSGMIQGHGNIQKNVGGTSFTWRTRFRRNPMDAYGDGQTHAWSRQDEYKTAEMPWRGYIVKQSFSDWEAMLNKGKEAIVNLGVSLQAGAREDIEENFGQKLYANGYASGVRDIHGVESMFSATVNSTITAGDLAARVWATTGTYAGISTGRSVLGGSWNGIWPDGYGTTDYDHWSPLVINYRHASFNQPGNASATWDNTCLKATRFAAHQLRRNKGGKNNSADFGVIDRGHFIDFTDSLDAKERIVADGRDSKSKKLGFDDYIIRDGVEFTGEYGIPPSVSTNDSRVSYILNVKRLNIVCCKPDLFEVVGPEYKIEHMAHLMAVTFAGNMYSSSPACHAKLIAN